MLLACQLVILALVVPAILAFRRLPPQNVLPDTVPLQYDALSSKLLPKLIRGHLLDGVQQRGTLNDGEQRTSCCGDLGCFPITSDFFHILHRPINAAPNCAIRTKLKMRLNTRENPDKSEFLDLYDSAATIGQSHFQPQRPTKVIIHGLMDRYVLRWNRQMMEEFLLEGDYNVIRLDWSAGNQPPYTQAVANSRLVGVFTAQFIKHLVDEYGARMQDFHLIGHSLGTHTACYAGEHIRLNYGTLLQRITALDPAGPYFENMPPTVRCDPTDANFIDTIISDGQYIIPNMGLGSSQPMGHINFYPNGGTLQPGCENLGPLNRAAADSLRLMTAFDLLEMLTESMTETFICSHMRALMMFVESINTAPCSICSYECTTYTDFLEGKCFSCKDATKCSKLGYFVNASLAHPNVQNKFYTLTADATPLCTTMYKFQMTLQNKTKENQAKTAKGMVKVTLHGTRGSSNALLLSENAVTMEPGKTYRFMVESRRDLGVVHSLVLYWVDSSHLVDVGKAKIIHLHGNLLLTDQSELISEFQPTQSAVKEKRNQLASFVTSHSQ
ncbi:hypothetical protein RvY_12503 [Ramazzottius varieornatus]|uniref:Lipase domain-containing protein n=1 Tax=Ramazzottius varieornatus TaxID=947166 RepID=A0A1D1VLP2_RAMVA|nr:hypothetical protein RvY_12503 [Ramazzottius varieornatus]